VVLAQGGGFQIYFQLTRAGWIDTWMVRIMADVARFCRARRRISFGTRTVPQVALLLPRSELYKGSDRLFGPWGTKIDGVAGILHALLELHYSVDVLAEHHLERRLDEYPFLVLPEVSAVPDELKEIVRAFVQAGGNCLVVGPKTAECFGEELSVKIKKVVDLETFYIEGGDALAWMGGTWADVEMRSAEPMGRGFATSDTRKNGRPIGSIRHLGDGNIAGFYGPFGTVYRRSHTPAARRCLGDMLRRVFPSPLVEVVAPPSVDVVLREAGKSLVIHLINTSNMQISPEYATIDHIPPAGAVAVEVRTKRRPRYVLLEPDGSPLTWDHAGGVLAISLELHGIHSAITIGWDDE